MTRVARYAVLLAIAAAASACAGRTTQPDPDAHAFTGLNATANVQGRASDGGAIFFQNCASCHAADGTGGFGPALVGDPVARDYAQVMQQVEDGRGAMPGFRGILSDAEIHDVSAYVVEALAQPLPITGAAAPLPEAATSPAALRAPPNVRVDLGKIVYERQCASCHAPDGSGGPLAEPLSNRPIAYDALVAFIIDGNVQHGMPGYLRLLSPEQIEQVAAYVDERLLGPNSVQAGSGGSASASNATSKS